MLAGREDFVAPPSQAERIRRGVPAGELVVLERSGHHPYAEEPDAFAATVRGWLARNEPRPHAAAR